MNPIRFEPNIPQVLSLADTTGDLDGYHVLYETTDGRILKLPRPAAIQLNMLDPAPGEEISITRYRKDREPSEWIIALTPQSEQARAGKEAQELAERTRQDTGRQLVASLQAVNGTRPPRKVPVPARKLNGEAPDQELGTGTWGPLPQVALASRKPQREVIPMNIAVREVVQFVTLGLTDAGEQWADAAKQDLVSTCIIAGAKAGWIGPWERGGEK
jgi:hypothetical protein